jgi:hypothetical protein
MVEILADEFVGCNLVCKELSGQERLEVQIAASTPTLCKEGKG